MTSPFLWGAGSSNNGLITSALTLMTTELNSLASSSGVVSSAGGLSTNGVFNNTLTGQAILGDVSFLAGAARSRRRPARTLVHQIERRRIDLRLFGRGLAACARLHHPLGTPPLMPPVSRHGRPERTRSSSPPATSRSTSRTTRAPRSTRPATPTSYPPRRSTTERRRCCFRRHQTSNSRPGERRGSTRRIRLRASIVRARRSFPHPAASISTL